MQAWPVLRKFHQLRAFGRVYGIGVVEDHERRMAAELAGNPFHVRGGLAGEHFADGG